MPAFFLALIAAVAATLAGREAVRVARLSAALGGGLALLAAIVVAAVASSAFAGWLGAALAGELTPPAKQVLVALALAVGAAELVVLRPHPAPREPTRSFPAILLVLLSTLLTDAARLLVLALAASTGGPWLAAAGGAIGTVAVLAAAWALAGEWETRLPLAALRWGLAGLMVFTALVAAGVAAGVVG